MSTSYITTHGTIWGEISSTGAMRAYGHDALGSVVTTFAGGAVQNTYRYKPYGGILSKTGTAANPSFLWNGRSGYRATGLTNADYYVRRRHFSVSSGGWSSLDSRWPRQRGFAYVGGRPTTTRDPSGLNGSNSTAPQGTCCCTPQNIQLADVKYYLDQTGASVQGGVCEGASPCEYYLGATFAVEVSSLYTANAGNGTPGPCKFDWTEVWNYGSPPPVSQACWPRDLQNCAAEGVCPGTLKCSLFDIPGSCIDEVFDSNPEQLACNCTYSFIVCITLTLSGTCGAPTIARYITFTATAVPTYFDYNQVYQFSVDVSMSSSPCNSATRTPEWSNCDEPSCDGSS